MNARAGRLAARALLPFARGYARHVGIEVSDRDLLARLQRRAAAAPGWARAGMVVSGLAVRWLAPVLVLGRPGRFEKLATAAKERLLARLQHARNPGVRGLFLLGKAPVLLALYGDGKGRDAPPGR